MGRVFVKTIGPFWPKLNDWLKAPPDTRFEPMVDYAARFLCWWGLLLFGCKLGRRRPLDCQLRDDPLAGLHHVNLLAQTEQTSLPVHKTLSHFLGHVGSAPLAQLRTDCVRQLMRNKVLASSRWEGCFTLAVDGAGFLSFHQRHCDHCLVHEHETYAVYLQPVLEAKLVDTRGLALSRAAEFIENPNPQGSGATPPALTTDEAVKQDCELKAFGRLAENLKKQFPQTRFCIGGDSLYACAPVFALCAQHTWSFVLTFKEGRTPALGPEFQSLLPLAPENRLVVHLPDKTQPTFRWANDLEHSDEPGRAHKVHALIGEESGPAGKHTFAWLTDFRLQQNNGCAIASQGGRVRRNMENQGFNLQKNSGLNLEHAYSTDPDVMKAFFMKAFYYLWQIAHLFLQMFEMGSLLRRLAKDYNTTPGGLLGSLKNIAQRLLECLRCFQLEPEAFQTSPGQIRLSDPG